MNRRAVLLLALTPIALVLVLLAVAGLPSLPRAAGPPSAQAALDAAIQALDANDLDAFRATLAPELAARLTPRQFAACRERVARGPRSPQWSAAFHERKGRWLAGSLWCAP